MHQTASDPIVSPDFAPQGEPTAMAPLPAATQATWHDGRLWLWGIGEGRDGPDLLRVKLPDAEAPTEVPAQAVAGQAMLDALEAPADDAADSLKCLSQLLTFAREAVAREQFYPSAHRVHKGAAVGVVGSWRLLVGDSRDVERLESFAAAMPGACFCADEGFGNAVDRLELVETFLDMCCDTLVRVSLDKDEFFSNVHERAADPAADAEVRWVSALVNNADAVASDPARRLVRGRDQEVATLLDKVQQWTARLGDAGGEPWRLGFTLEEPTNPDDPEIGDVWKIEWRLLPPPDLEHEHAPLPAQQVWEQPAGSIGFVGRNAVRLRERMTAELQRAGDFLPPLGSYLKAWEGHYGPSQMQIDGATAFRLIRDWSESLREAGFDVQLPGWAGSKENRLEVVMNLRPADGTEEIWSGGTSRVGLDALLSFDWRIAVGGDAVTSEEFQALVAQGQPLVRRGGRWIEVDPEAAVAAAELLQRRPAGTLTLGEAFRAGFGLGEFRNAGGTAPAVRLAGTRWVEELLDQSPNTVAEKLPQPPEFKGDLRPYQLRGLQWLAFLDRLGLGGVLADDMGLGKAQPLDAKILTPSGWTTMGEVKIGQNVVGSDGRATKVTGVFPQGELEVFRVTFSDGATVECCDDHLWQVETQDWREKGLPPQVLPLREIRENLRYANGERRGIFIPMVKPVEFDVESGDPLLVPPAERRALLERLLTEHGGTACSTRTWIVERQLDRRTLENIRFLAQSLGGVAKHLARRDEGRWEQIAGAEPGLDLDGGLRLYVDLPTESRPDWEQPKRTIVSIEPVGKKSCQCISVEAADQLYVTNDFVVTHNTIQLISLLQHEKHHRPEAAPSLPTLLFVPTSVLGNWSRELQRFAPNLKVLAHHGPQRLRGEDFVKAASASDVVVTSYALSHRDQADLRKVTWNRVALDEAQKIKNPNAASSVAVRSIAAPRKVALTGTPVENHLGELWSIMDLLNPGLLGTQSEFRERFAIPIEKHNDRGRGRRLREMIKPFVLRRTKDEPEIAADLPEKMEMSVYCGLTAEQAALYERITGDMLNRIDTATGIRRRGLILSVLTKLKQVCDHPALLNQGDEEGDASAKKLRVSEAALNRSGKAQRLAEMLEEVIEEGEKALVFTQYRKMGDLLVPMLEKRLGRNIVFLHGGTPQQKRDEMVVDFQNNRTPDAPSVFILSLRAGGLGLNLTAASHVFHYDRWWNPAVEAQATDRAHRIGQTRRVQVHKFVTLGTVEERIDKMLAEKSALAKNIVGSGDDWLTELSTGELREYLSLSRQDVGGDFDEAFDDDEDGDATGDASDLDNAEAA